MKVLFAAVICVLCTAYGASGTDVDPAYFDVDISAPVVTVDVPASRYVTTSLPTLDLSGTASDNVALVRIGWSTGDGDAGDCIGTGAWSASSIPLVVGENVVTVFALDIAGNVGSHSVIVTRLPVVSEPVEEEDPISDVPGEWRGVTLASIPLIPDEVDPKMAVGFEGDNWAVFQPDLNAFVMYGDDPDYLTWFTEPETTPGRGFWAVFGADARKPAGIAPPQDQPATIRLFRGWNLIGQPFLSTVTWDATKIKVRTRNKLVTLSKAKLQGIVEDWVRGWQSDAGNPEGGYYYPVEWPAASPGARDYLVPWCAYWIRCYKDCELIIPPPQ